MQMKKKQGNRLSAAELSNFCGQVALILEAGLPLYDGMETLAGADSSSANAELYQAASRGVTNTGSLYEALKADGRWPDYLVEMVGIGEHSGQLEKVMRVSSRNIETTIVTRIVITAEKMTVVPEKNSI